MIEIGRVCYKIAGREAGKICVIVDIIDENYVLIDGLVKRRRANIKHLDLTPHKIQIQKGADTKTVIEELKKANLLSKEDLEYLEKKEKFGKKKKEVKKEKKETKEEKQKKTSKKKEVKNEK